MRYYQEITLLGEPEIGLNFLWTKVFQQIHLGLVKLKNEDQNSDIGLSFPAYSAEEKSCTMGNKFRLLAVQESLLEGFDARTRLDRLSDYVHCTGIRPVPARLSGHVMYRRVQPKNNASATRLARRYAQRKGVALEDALNLYRRKDRGKTNSPFIQLRSLSSGHEFCLWIERVEADENIAGTFSLYGLSSSRTVPEF